MSSDVVAYNERQRLAQVVRDQMAPDASDAELAYFIAAGNRLGLSPLAGHIVLIGRYDKRLRRNVHRPQITIDGRRLIASRTGKLRGIEGPVWCGPRERGELIWREVWDDDERYPYCARCLVYVDGWTMPANGTTKWSEFAQRDNAGALTATWRQMPSHMLGKVAESLALRRAFADVIGAAEASIDALPDPVEDDSDRALRPVDSYAAEIAERVEALDADTRNALGVYLAAQRIAWPPETPGALRRVERWLDATAEQAEQADRARAAQDRDAEEPESTEPAADLRPESPQRAANESPGTSGPGSDQGRRATASHPSAGRLPIDTGRKA
jgi:hypothetical protein